MHVLLMMSTFCISDATAAKSTCLPACCSARDAFLQQELGGEHEEVLTSISQCAEDLVACATAKLLRYLAYFCQAAEAQTPLSLSLK